MTTFTQLLDHFQPENYQVSLDIDRPGRQFTGTVTIHGMKAAGAERIGVHAKDLQIETVVFDGKAAQYEEAADDTLWITHDDLAPGKHLIIIGFSGLITDATHGMIRKFMHDGEAKELIATQFESHHAREVFPCIDEPAAKATFDVTLTTEPDITVLGNLHPTDQRVENNRLVTTFGTTPRMSTYLLAWVYGDLQKERLRQVASRSMFATPAQSADSLDFALDHAVRSIEFFDDYFARCTRSNRPRQLPDFSSGAMENWGCYLPRDCLLADPATTTIASRQYIAPSSVTSSVTNGLATW